MKGILECCVDSVESAIAAKTVEQTDWNSVRDL